MPEGPEVETVRRTLLPLVLGARLGKARVSRLALRTKITSKELSFLNGAVVDDVGRHGKLLWVRAGGGGMCIRLGMTGRVTVEATKKTPLPHTHVRIALDDGSRELRFCDPRRFGEVVPFVDDDSLHAERSRMGPDGITIDDDGRARVRVAVRKTSRSIKDALLDQKVVAGVGNIYAAEACFLAGLDPTRAGSSLSDDDVTRLIAAIEQTLADGVKNRGTSFSDYVDAEGQRGDNAAALHVFQREAEPCRRCGTVIARFTQGARSTFWCPGCQR
ncbi:MAG TPA: bifunctional DNA-formamidopyrimidine glycosylase/DNA-(apurinic or apyrimidinic site) lyase [Myxococcota bacterium]